MFNLFGVLLLVLYLVINLSGVQSQNVACQQDWTAYGGHCYWSVPGLRKSWDDAQSDCQSRDSNLVKIETAEENSWLKTFATLSDSPWIGATDRGKEGEWRWISDSTLISFTDWISGEPNNLSGNEHCCHIYTGARWNDLHCSWLQGFICEKEGVQSQNVAYQQNWTAYGGHCYWSVPGLRKSWDDAQSDCQSRDSNLVKIETAEENSWLKTFATLADYPWIGATDRGKEGEWRWISDNTLVSFTDWRSGEPNNVAGNEHCGQIYLGARWNDHVCSTLFGFICEKKVEEITEKCTSAINTVGPSENAGVADTNTGLVSSPTATSSSSSEYETKSASPLSKGENICSPNPASSVDHSNKKSGPPDSNDLTDQASNQVNSDRTDTGKSVVSTDQKGTASSVVSTNKTESPGVIADQTDSVSPLADFRPGYLWVSDLTKQHWCEQQLLYSFTVPGVVVEDPVMTKGSDLHLQRELAVHDVVKVDITSSEDIWAVKMLNLLNSVQAFLHGSPLAREVPIFGAPYQEDVFVVGLIDELRFDLETYAIGLSELKTRLSRTKPSKSQEKQHRLQVMLYKKLFDDLVKGNVTKDTVSRHLRLKLTKELGEGVQGELDKSGLSCKTLDSLLDVVFGRMAAVTCIGETSVEYVHQESGQSFLHQNVVYDEEELKKLYHHYLGFWRGQRESISRTRGSVNAVTTSLSVNGGS